MMILANSGRLLWYSPRSWVVRDLKVVEYDGRPMLAFYRAVPPDSSTEPYYVLLDDHYRVVTRIYAGNGYRINTHELEFTPGGTAYISAYKHVLEPSSGRKIIDYVLQEIDLETRDVLFEWHSLDHVPPSASYMPQPSDDTAWDYFHGNSIDATFLPTLIVSARNTSAVYGISRTTGRVQWILGGKQDTFSLVEQHPSWQFCAQHDARRLPNGDISLFDNGGRALWAGARCPVHPSRVQRFRLDLASKTVRLIRTISSLDSSEDGKGFYPWAVGSARRQPNGDMLIGWGTTGRITEVTPGGEVNFGLRLARYSYRAIRAPWVGRPPGQPLIAASRTESTLRIWASWNGATQIRRWRVIGGQTRSALAALSEKPFAGLETSIRLTTPARYVAVEALSATGRVLGRSRVVSAS